MSSYFSYFPTLEHDLTNVGQTVTLTNILKRFKIVSALKTRTDTYYKYNVRPGDRPDTIAEKYYSSANYAWIILIFNDIIDPQFGWPLFDQDFEEFIKGKYGSIPTAESTVHEYRQVLSTAIVKVDGTRIPKRTVVVDLETFNALAPVDREQISKFDFEEEVNDDKREIRILDKRYISTIRDEVKSILRNGI